MDADFEPQDSADFQPETPQEPSEPAVNMEDFIFGVHPFDLMAFALVLLILCSVFYIVQAGLFAKIDVKTIEPKDGAMVVAYKSARGPYKGAGEIFTDICSIIMNRDHIGIYYDDPDAVAGNDLRYAVGTILATGSEEPDPAELELVSKHGFKIAHFPKPNYVVLAEFPFTNTLSIYMGIFRVYPKLKEYIATHGLCAYPALEIYTSNKIKFMMPLSKQEDFFVPEFCEEQVSIATSIATTEISNHPDHAGADEELKTLEGNSTGKRSLKKISSTAGDDVFVRPATPPPPTAAPKEESNEDTEKNNDTESNDNITAEEVEEDEDSSEFEKIDPEN